MVVEIVSFVLNCFAFAGMGIAVSVPIGLSLLEWSERAAAERAKLIP